MSLGAITTPEFQSLVFETPSGPHVTMQAGVLLADRYWTTTSRHAYKVQAIRETGRAAVLVPDGDDLVSITGSATIFDPRRPQSLLSDPAGAAVLAPAVAGIALSNVPQLLGYAEAGRLLPSAWLPQNRVIIAVRAERRLRVERPIADDAWRDTPDPTPLAEVPDAARDVLEHDGSVTVGLLGPAGPIAVPGAWTAERDVVVPTDALAHSDAVLPGSACVANDDSRSRRPDRKRGAVLRGTAHVAHRDTDVVRLAVTPRRLTTWDGFEAETVSLP